MGTDIHGGFIKISEDGSKEAIETSWGMDRDYTLFAILAGVRNGFGFAGCYRHEPLEPIAADRGKPDFIAWGGYEDEDGWQDEDSDCTKDLICKWYGKYQDAKYGEWCGEHSHTYMNVKEILEWEGWDTHLEQGGFVSLDHYKETVAQGIDPQYWCGGVGGGDTLTLTEEDLLIKELAGTLPEGKNIYVECKWESKTSLREDKEYFLKEIERIRDEFGEDTYMVIGFDS